MDPHRLTDVNYVIALAFFMSNSAVKFSLRRCCVLAAWLMKIFIILFAWHDTDIHLFMTMVVKDVFMVDLLGDNEWLLQGFIDFLLVYLASL